MRILGIESRRTGSEFVAGIFTAVIIVGLAEYAWFALPRPGASGRLILSATDAFSIYKLVWTGDGRRNLVFRTLIWTLPVLLVQIAFQLLVFDGTATLD